MSKTQQILEIIADILEVEMSEISPSMELGDGRWDSLAVVTFISEIDSNFDQVISPTAVSAVKTVADLIALVE